MLPGAFEVLGPIMVGPSSSHTAGALRIALVAAEIAPAPVTGAIFTLYNSFAQTYRGHGTDKALVAGLLGLATNDEKIAQSFELAREAGLTFSFVEVASAPELHPNTVDICLLLAGGATLTVRGESVGGGRMRVSAIGGVAVDVSGEYPTLFVHHKDQPGMLAGLTGSLSTASINIATIRTFRNARGKDAYTVIETDEAVPEALVEAVAADPGVVFATRIKIPGTQVDAPAEDVPDIESAAAALSMAEAQGLSLGALMRQREAHLSGGLDAADAQMKRVLAAMRRSAQLTIDAPRRSLGGFLDGQARQIMTAAPTLAPTLLGATLAHATAYACAVLELSASMGVIVAAPTAGSAGVVPGALIAAAESLEAPDEALLDALWCTALVGGLVMSKSTIAGAEGGCQAEVGTASAMAAAGLVALMGGSPKTCFDAAALALGNLLGLVCDPAQGLVEYPCQNRNALGVACAYSAAQLALSGIVSAAPFDEVIDAHRRVGAALPSDLRETAQGGLATCPSVCSTCGGCA